MDRLLGKANSYNYMEQEDVTLLKMVGECIAANENQLKRLMSKVMSRSQVSLRLKKFRRYGFVERWDLNSLDDGFKAAISIYFRISRLYILKALL